MSWCKSHWWYFRAQLATTTDFPSKCCWSTNAIAGCFSSRHFGNWSWGSKPAAKPTLSCSHTSASETALHWLTRAAATATTGCCSPAAHSWPAVMGCSNIAQHPAFPKWRWAECFGSYASYFRGCQLHSSSFPGCCQCGGSTASAKGYFAACFARSKDSKKSCGGSAPVTSDLACSSCSERSVECQPRAVGHSSCGGDGQCHEGTSLKSWTHFTELSLNSFAIEAEDCFTEPWFSSASAAKLRLTCCTRSGWAGWTTAVALCSGFWLSYGSKCCFHWH